jgi:hypothetical protein
VRKIKHISQERHKNFQDYELENTPLTRIIFNDEAIFIHSSCTDIGCWRYDIRERDQAALRGLLLRLPW